MITLREVLPHFCGNKAALARALKISRQAVGQWAIDEAIPEAQELKIRYEVLPGVFGQPEKKPTPDLQEAV